MPSAFSFFEKIPTWAKVLGTLALAFSIGWGSRGTFTQQVGLPALAARTATRVDDIEHRMDAAENQIAVVALNTQRLRSLAAKVDTLTIELEKQGDMALGTYCIVWAHAKGFDIGQECTLIPPPFKVRE